MEVNPSYGKLQSLSIEKLYSLLKEKYQFKFNQAMRDTILNEVISLGLK